LKHDDDENGAPSQPEIGQLRDKMPCERSIRIKDPRR
jgi:hypothetical protein